MSPHDWNIAEWDVNILLNQTNNGSHAWDIAQQHRQNLHVNQSSLSTWSGVPVKCKDDCLGKFYQSSLCITELPHDKTYKMTVQPVKTQIILGICPVWSVFAVSMKKPWSLSYPLSAQQRLWSKTSAQSDLSLHWAHIILLVLSWGGSYLDTNFAAPQLPAAEKFHYLLKQKAPTQLSYEHSLFIIIIITIIIIYSSDTISLPVLPTELINYHTCKCGRQPTDSSTRLQLKVSNNSNLLLLLGKKL